MKDGLVLIVCAVGAHSCTNEFRPRPDTFSVRDQERIAISSEYFEFVSLFVVAVLLVNWHE